MAFEIGREQPQVGEPLAWNEAGLRPHRVQQRRRVALRQHEAIGVGMLRILRVEAHLGEEQRRHQVGGRQQVVGWPLADAVVARIDSMRSRVAMFFSDGQQRRVNRQQG